MPLTPAPSFIHLGVISAGRQRGPGVHQADHGARLPLACKKKDKGSNAAREQGAGGRGISWTQPRCSGIAAGLLGCAAGWGWWGAPTGCPSFSRE